MIVLCQRCKKEFNRSPADLVGNKGKYCSRDCKNIASKGKHFSLETEFSKGNKGFWLGKKRVGLKHDKQFKKGFIPWNKGLKTGIRPWLGKKRPEMYGEKNKAWKGDNIGYMGLHSYIKNKLQKPKKCSNCDSSRFIQLSNISGIYKRKLSDWQWLCAKCHYHYDRDIETTNT